MPAIESNRRTVQKLGFRVKYTTESIMHDDPVLYNVEYKGKHFYQKAALLAGAKRNEVLIKKKFKDLDLDEGLLYTFLQEIKYRARGYRSEKARTYANIDTDKYILNNVFKAKGPLKFSEGKGGKRRIFLWSKRTDPYLARLSDMYELGKLESDRDHLQTLKNCLMWVHGRWKHSGATMPRKSDPISILKEAETGRRFKCSEYAIVLKASLASLGIRARRLNLLTASSGTSSFGMTHALVEAYMPEYKKWVMADGQFGTIPMLEGIPLSAVELQSALASARQVAFWNMKRKDFKSYKDFIYPYLFYFSTAFDNRITATSKRKTSFILAPLGAKRYKKAWGRSFPPVYTNSKMEFYREPQRAI
jgi:hypothetical protein